MPLAECDINTQREPRLKRHSTKINLNYMRLNDENSPLTTPTTSKGPPPSNRLLAPTKASAAKATSPPARAASQSKPKTRLPRRQDANIASPRSIAASATVDMRPSGNHTPNSVILDKPLPPRPIVQIETSSPPKVSRTLFDASEKTSPVKHYSLLQPMKSIDLRSAHASDVERTTSIFSPDRWASDGSSRLIDTALSTPDLNDPDTTSATRQCCSAFETSAMMEGQENDMLRSTQTHQGQQNVLTPGCDLEPELPTARETCGPQLAWSKPVLGGASFAVPGFTELFVDSPGSRSNFESRPHSPSPASFSRPRPNSVSHHGQITPVPSTPGVAPFRSIRAQKTASRIPIPDPKRATLIDVKPKFSTSGATPLAKPPQVPCFGRRGLVSAVALETLDQGRKRRQRNAGFDTSTTTLSSTDKTYVHSAGSLTDRSRASSPENTFGASSSDEEEISTPIWQHGTSFQAPRDVSSAAGYCHSAASLLDHDSMIFHKSPPSSSPYTVPLQTIPSQAALPLYEETDQDEDLLLSGSAPTPDVTQSRSQPYERPRTHFNFAATPCRDSGRDPRSTKYELLDILGAYTDQTERYSTEGMDLSDAKADSHITRTLSMLEGNIAPVDDSVDQETLERLYGHVRLATQSPANKASMIDNAAAAQRFLAQANSAQGVSVYQGEGAYVNEGYDLSDNKPQLPPIEAVASKWSDSTSSPDMIAHQVDLTTEEHPHKAPQQASPVPPSSIGYPSRISSKKAMLLIGPGRSGASTPVDHNRRLSSPTLGKRKPGSVKVARENLQNRGFSRPTASAEAKKTSKMAMSRPKLPGLPSSGRRGRMPSVEKPLAKDENNDVQIVAKRARSRSRFMMDKISSMFLHRRDTKVFEPPRVTAVVEDNGTSPAGPAPIANIAFSIAGQTTPGTRMTTTPPQTQTKKQCKDSYLMSAENPNSATTVATAGHAHQSSVLSWSDKLHAKAARESDPTRKLRLLEFVQVLRESHENARNAQISCMAAREAAIQAGASYLLVQQGMTILQRLAAQIGGPDA
ncbi:hypothetical protein LTR62_007103 [Meristemomyces frigidus]|uniref:Uncharacterized protein n=1 Tax=Meristemomyces frigidus TaxID=1508187 RepID=A0AAN7TMP0_9PEZI|nr:hypothetical protein LTR62_007103 [Meristemomyces frigidus]